MKLHADSKVEYNFIVNILDGGFFGLAIGFASFTTIIPLFINTLTNSALLIGSIPAIHNVGWQLPQLATARWIPRLKRIKPAVLILSLCERIPFFGFAVIAWLVPSTGKELALALIFGALIFEGVSAGLVANAWQSLMGKIIPPDLRGTFFGTQSAASNLLSAGAAVIAGIILEGSVYPHNFALCFLLAGISMMVAFFFLGKTREEPKMSSLDGESSNPSWKSIFRILRSDRNFFWFIVARSLSPFGMMGFSFYIVYQVNKFDLSDSIAGVMTGVLLMTQVVANPLLGWLGDRFNQLRVLELGILCAILSSLLAFISPSLGWFYAVFILSGVANVAYWIVGITTTMKFGTEEKMPTYIGLANTLAAPSTIIAPLVGGWLADVTSYQTSFLIAAILGVVNIIVMHVKVADPSQRSLAV